ncbi:hypothetical protein VTH82DRAFT_4912 [Thermothelomyces myriococcoides]
MESSSCTTPTASASSVSTDALELTEVDVDCDLVLHVGSKLGKKQDFRFCSATMRRASPVWKAMFCGPWQEAQPTWPTNILLIIIHSKFCPVQLVKGLGGMYRTLIVASRSPWTLPQRFTTALWACEFLGSIWRSQQRLGELGPLLARADTVARSANEVMHPLSDVFACVHALHPSRKS